MLQSDHKKTPPEASMASSGDIWGRAVRAAVLTYFTIFTARLVPSFAVATAT